MKPKVKKPSEKEQQEAESWPIWEKEESKFPREYDTQETCLRATDFSRVLRCIFVV